MVNLSSIKRYKRDTKEIQSTAFIFITLPFTLAFRTAAEMPLNWFERKLVSFQHQPPWLVHRQGLGQENQILYVQNVDLSSREAYLVVLI